MTKKRVIINQLRLTYSFYKLIKSKNNFQLHNKGVRLDVNKKNRTKKTIEHVNEKVQFGITQINGKESESINVTISCNKEANKYKENSVFIIIRACKRL